MTINTSEKKKILVLVDWFAPGFKAGGPIQSCVNFSLAMRKHFSVHVLTTDTDHGEKEPYPGIPGGQWTDTTIRDVQVFYLEKRNLSARQIRAQIDRVDPDFVYLNHLFSPLFVIYPLWLKYTGRIRGKMVVCPRGALYDSALAVKSWKKFPFLRLFKLAGIQKKIIFHATNDREKKAIELYFPNSNILIADNLPNMDQAPFASCGKTPGTLRIIFVARIVAIKNLLFFLRALKQVKAQIELTVVGPVEEQAYWEECKSLMAGLDSNISVSYLGPKQNSELPALLRQHHLFVLPTTGENFGHSIFEALLAGRPVLISDQTPWLGLAEKKAGWDLPLDDTKAFSRIVEQAAAWDQQQFDEWALAAWNYARRFIENPELQNQYLRLFV